MTGSMHDDSGPIPGCRERKMILKEDGFERSHFYLLPVRVDSEERFGRIHFYFLSCCCFLRNVMSGNHTRIILMIDLECVLTAMIH